MCPPKIKTVTTIDQRTLRVVFENGETRLYDVARLWDQPMFAPLKNPALFQQVKVEPGGYAVSWNDEIDISEYELWRNGVAVRQGRETTFATSGSP